MHVCACKNNLDKHCINFLWALRTFLIPYSSSASASASSAYVTHATISKVHALYVCVCACSVCAPLFCLAALWSSFAFGVIEKPTKNTKTSHVVTRTRTHTHTQMYKHAHAHARTGSCRAAVVDVSICSCCSSSTRKQRRQQQQLKKEVVAAGEQRSQRERESREQSES